MHAGVVLGAQAVEAVGVVEAGDTLAAVGLALEIVGRAVDLARANVLLCD
jgi:hypothetical protein